MNPMLISALSVTAEWLVKDSVKVNNVSHANQKGLKKNHHANSIRKKREILIVVEWDKGVGLKDFCKLPGFVLHDILTKKLEHYNITYVYKMGNWQIWKCN